MSHRPLLEMHLEKPMGLFPLLDEESLFPNGTDESLSTSARMQSFHPSPLT